MREVLFRGKDDESGKFVYGLLSLERDCRNPKALCTIKPCIVWEKNGLLHSAFVESNSVGQYTGLTDKNGTKIFEGDILSGHWQSVSEIYYDDCYCQFRAKEKENEINNPIDYYCGFPAQTEIIGNIYDNPELIKI